MIMKIFNFIKEWKFRRFVKKRLKEYHKRLWEEVDKKALNSLVDDGILEEKYRIK